MLIIIYLQPSPTENQSQFMIKSKLPVRKAKSHHNFPLSGVVSKISQSSNDLQIHTESHTDNLEDTTSGNIICTYIVLHVMIFLNL